jgi:hypothetical protein
MEYEEMTEHEQEMHELNGAIAALDTLREKLELRLNEARDECVREALDNVIELARAYEIEYRHRRQDLQAGITQ